jgi:hypothetical protein
MAASTDTLKSTPARAALVALQLIVGAFTPLALTSIGGLGIYSAPLLLPLVWITAFLSGTGGRIYFTFLALLLIGEVMWVVAWNLIPELELTLPLVAMAVTPFLFIVSFRRRLDAREVVVIAAVLSLIGLLGIASLAADAPQAEREIEVERRAP